MDKRAKEKYDQKTLRKYERQLRNRRKEYLRQAEAYSLTGRRNRAAAIGECVLKLQENLQTLMGDLTIRKKHLIDGSLFWGIDEKRVKDTDGKKGFKYTIWYAVKSDEDYYTEEEIAEELKKTYSLMHAETEEMYAEVEDDGRRETETVD